LLTAQLLGFSRFVTGLRSPALCRSGIKGIRIWFVTRICRYRASLICFREKATAVGAFGYNRQST